MHILITNDDDYLAPGIGILARELSQVADITVVAPDRNRGGASNSLTLMRPLRVEQAAVSITPMQVDLTRHRGIDPLQSWPEAM
jgi:5'/3'-nucleotidase SurE